MSRIRRRRYVVATVLTVLTVLVVMIVLLVVLLKKPKARTQPGKNLLHEVSKVS